MPLRRWRARGTTPGARDSSSTPFGFTGERQDAGLVELRARWYNPGSGTFHTRDPFAGWSAQPFSLHPYALGDPVWWTDAPGTCSGPGCPSTGDGVDLLFGFLEQWAYVNSLGTVRTLAPGPCDPLAETIGRHLGNAAGVIQGMAEMVGGAAVAAHGASVATVAAAQSGALAGRALMSTTDGSDSSIGNSGNSSSSREFFKEEDNGAAIQAFLDDEGTFWTAIKVPDGLKGKGIGSRLFGEAWEAIGNGGRATGIGGKWNTAKGMRDNLDQFNTNLRAGMEPDNAALNIFTGKQALTRGFKTVKFNRSDGPYGRFTNVEVIFK